MGQAATCFLFALALPAWVLASDGHHEQEPEASDAATCESACPRVRPASPAIAEAVERASERSRTFRRLIEAINRTDGIIYIQEGKCRRQVLACLPLAVTVAGNHRILHIRVDTRRKGIELSAALGHELRHAIEVLSDPTITTGLKAFNFYLRKVPTDIGRFETEAAIQIGLDVQAEMEAWMKRR